MFIETPRFPEDISYGARGGPTYSTSIVKRLSGREIRNINWAYPLHKYNAAMAVRAISDLDTIIDFFHVTSGAADAFRYKDWADYKTVSALSTPTSTDQLIGVGDGVEVDFQLTKTYQVGSSTKVRNITKPVTGTVLISLNDVTQGAGWTVNTVTGIVTFAVAPGGGVNVKWGGEFDVPVRFESDDLQTSIVAYDSGVADINIVEVRL